MQRDYRRPIDHEENLRGEILRVTYRNAENGYAVVQLRVEDAREEVTAVGYCLHWGAGVNLMLRGEYKTHPQYGRQFVASDAQEVTPTTSTGMVKYLSSGLVKGIGEKTAQKIVEALGEETFEVIYRDPERLAAVPGVGSRKAQLICAEFAEKRGRAEIDRFFVEHNISVRLARRIFDLYGSKSVETVSRNPYILAHELKGVGFATADSIALNLGFAPDSPHRLKAGLFYALEKARDEGHCFLDRQDLFTRTYTLLGIEGKYDLDEPLEILVREEFAVREEDRIYLERLYEAENFVARFVVSRCTPFEEQQLSISKIADCVREAESRLRITFSADQHRAVELAMHYPLLLITGGPGCGKTTVIRGLVTTFRAAGKSIALAAPTGKAAQRMGQVCELPSKTIHRLLKFDPSSGRFLHGSDAPLLADADFGSQELDALIIDEASMIDLPLARSLFAAMPRSATLILVGDKDQLPSVGPGRVFADMLSVKEVKTVSLSQLFRRSEESRITTIAHQINAGIKPDIPEPDGVTKSDAYFVRSEDAEESAGLIEKLVADQLPRKFGLTPDDITVLTPSNRGPLGSIELNQRLQNRLNTGRGFNEVLNLQSREFRVGDRVCQRVNNYKIDPLGVFNGDIGTVYSVEPQQEKLTVELWDGRLINYEKKELAQLSLSYVMTVHRSQGSEMPCVVLVLHKSHSILLERQLLYTGVTRAKQLLVIVGSGWALNLAAKRTSTRRRLTYLRERIQQALR